MERASKAGSHAGKLAFVADFVGMLGELGLGALRRDRKHAEFTASEERHRRLFDNATEGLVVFRVERDGAGEVDDVVLVDLNPTQAARMRAAPAELLGRRRSAAGSGDATGVAAERLLAYFALVADADAAGRSTRREVRFGTQGVCELLSAYSAGGDFWVLSATDLTDLREAERALRRQEGGVRRAYVDVLDAATGGKLVLLTEEQLADELGAPLGHQVVFGAPVELATARRWLVRAAETVLPGKVDPTDLLSAVGEALDNALEHAAGGAYQAFARDGRLQVAVSDDGPGMDLKSLPRAALVPGYSTAASLGMGFTIMLGLCERVLLVTRPGHTVVVLEFSDRRQAAFSSTSAGAAV